MNCLGRFVNRPYINLILPMIRVRSAPSPTGFMHIGNLRTALYNYLFAKKHGGTYLLRIEDTDRERMVDGGVEAIIKVLNNVGLAYTEGPMIKDGHVEQVGPFGPYIQSMRLPIYQKYVDQLVRAGHAYYCFCSSEELESQRAEQQALKLPTKYNRRCLSLPAEEVEKKLALNESHVVRMKVPEGETSFVDTIRGTITIQNSEIDDQVLMKSDGFPTYHLANIVDDHLMEITHVIRGEEWISSTPKHVMLYQMLQWKAPEFAHCPLLLNADHSKLSKRQGDVAAEDYLSKGYLPEALLNFLCLLGYNPKGDQEIYSMEEMIELFDLSKVNPSGAVVNFDKLKWMNEHYIREKSTDQLMELCLPYVREAGKSVEPELFKRLLEVEKQRLTTLADIVDQLAMYTDALDYNAQTLVWKKADEADAKKNLEAIRGFLQDVDAESFTLNLEEKTKEWIAGQGLQNGNVLWPLRVALSGRSQSPSPFELAYALGKDEVLRRIDAAVNKLR